VSDSSSHKQGWFLFLATGVDCRKCNLTKDEAAQLIDTALKDPTSVQKTLISKGGELKSPKNLQAALRRIEKFGVSFKPKEKKDDSMELILNHKKDKKIRRKISSRIGDIVQEIGKDYSRDQDMYQKVAEILNKEGYRCCDGSEWQHKSVYDFYRRSTKKKRTTRVVASVSMNEIKAVHDSVDKESLLKTAMNMEADASVKVEILKKIIMS
jgi:hypothetical protein